MIRLIVLGLIVLFAVLAASPANAQSRRELAARLDGAEARLAEVEARALQGDPVAEILMRRLDQLEREQRALTGEVERLAFENRTLREELEQTGRDVDAILRNRFVASSDGSGPVSATGEPALLNADEIDPEDQFAEVRAQNVQPLQMPSAETEINDAEIQQVETGLAQARQPAMNVQTQGLATVGMGSSRGAADVPMGADDLYAQGRSRLLEGDFAGARESFAAFTETHPDHAQADEAYYWLGETYFVSGRLDEAADSYIASLQTDRSGPQGPDALVRLGASLAGLGETDRACQVLATFPNEFPNASADARRKAQREVARIGCS